MNTTYDIINSYNPTIAMGSANTYQIVLAPNNNKTIFNKIGNVTGKTVSFFRKSQTKATVLLTYWAFESMLFSLIILTAVTPLVFFSALFLYLYGTYALFSAINVLTK